MKVSKLLFLQVKPWGFAYSHASRKGLSERPEMIRINSTAAKAVRSFEPSLLNYAVVFHPLQIPLFSV